MTREGCVDVTVVGGGVLGVSAAYHLALGGARVRLLERHRVGAGASWGNAGTISAGHPPLNGPGRIRRALGQLTDPTSPLYVPPRWDPPLWRWLADFALHCTEEQVERCMEVLAPLGMDALASFDSLLAAETIECGYRARGYWAVCSTEAGLAECAHEAAIIRGYGYTPTVTDAAGVREAEPALGPVAGGVFYPQAATLDPAAFLEGLADAARRQGVRIIEGMEVVRLGTERRGGRAVHLGDGSTLRSDAVVVCTGPYDAHLLRPLGVRLAVQPGKGYHVDLPVRGGAAPDLSVACVLHESSVFCTPMAGRLRLAGTMEFSGFNRRLDRRRLDQILSAAGAAFPSLVQAELLSEWCGLRPVSSDGLPIVGPVPGHTDVVVATGHGMLGLTLGPVSGRIVAEWVLGDGPREGYRVLAPGRLR